MAQTVDEILQALITLKENTPELDDLTTDSKVSLWGLTYSTVAQQLQFQQQLWDTHKSELDEYRSTFPVNTQAWWNYQMTEIFQYNVDPDKGLLQIDEYRIPRYAIIDVPSQIISFSATSVSTSLRVLVKIAKDVGGIATQLTEDELLSAKEFGDKIQPAGIKVDVQSFPPDKISVEMDVYYDANYVQSEVADNIKSAMDGYLSDVGFEGIIKILNLEDAIQQVDGVTNLVIYRSYGRADGGNLIEITDQSGRTYDTKAGYSEMNFAVSTINYIQK